MVSVLVFPVGDDFLRDGPCPETALGGLVSLDIVVDEQGLDVCVEDVCDGGIDPVRVRCLISLDLETPYIRSCTGERGKANVRSQSSVVQLGCQTHQPREAWCKHHPSQ